MYSLTAFVWTYFILKLVRKHFELEGSCFVLKFIYMHQNFIYK